MTTYAIGDIQGCFSALEALLKLIQFDPSRDRLWLTGDLVNRGPASLDVLRAIKSLAPFTRVVLGNHDLHLLAVYFKAHPGGTEDTLQDILKAADVHELMDWLLHQPLIHHDATLGYTMVHAGLAPSWDIITATTLAKEVEDVLQGPAPDVFLTTMYGDTPNQWHPGLTGFDRLRAITNYLTRARFCYVDGSLELGEKNRREHPELIPWFKHPARKTEHENIIFGHWAALSGITETPHTFALDTGCVWGFCLTAMSLEEGKYYSVPCVKMKEL